jgi:hypothetical protein
MATTSGLWVPDTFTIHPESSPEAPRFTKHPDVANGDIVFLRLTGHAEKAGEVRPDHVERLLVGQGWETLDGGKTISHPTDTSYPGFLGFGRWIDWAKQQDELIDYVAGRGIQSATEARFWAGLSLALDLVSETYTLKKDSKKGKAGETVTSTYIMPVKFLGANLPINAANTSQSNVPTVTREELLALASTSSSHAEFMSQALTVYPALRQQSFATLFGEVANPDSIYREAKS